MLPLRATNSERLTTLSEKLLHQIRRTSGQYSAPDFHLMIQAGVIRHLQNRMDGACLGVVGTVHQAADSGMNCRSRAHGARLNCSKEFAVAKTVIRNVSSGLAQRDDFSVSAGIAVGEVAIPASSDDPPAAHYDGSDRHFTRLQCALGTAQGLLHPEFVGPTFVRTELVSGEQWSITSGRLPAKPVLSSRFSVKSV